MGHPSCTQQSTIHDILSTHVHSFFPSFFILTTSHSREIQINNTLHICSHYFLRNDSCIEYPVSPTTHRISPATHRISPTTHRNPSQPIATPSQPIASHRIPSQPHRNPSHPIATPSSMTSFQHMCIHSSHLFSFFKHCKREKFK
jgi:hypothetical protein